MAIIDNNTELIIRVRIISEADIVEGCLLLNSNEQWTQARLAHELCKRWQWCQKNGEPKVRGCTEVINKLKQLGRISFQKRSKKARQISNISEQKDNEVLINKKIDGSLSEQLPLAIKVVEGSKEIYLWRQLMERHHYLGFNELIGASIKQIVFNKRGDLVAALGWQSGVYHLECRDELIGWDIEQRCKNLDQVATNTRFLIMPWVRVRNLASKILAESVKNLKAEWRKKYQIDLGLLETFVDRSRLLSCRQNDGISSHEK